MSSILVRSTIVTLASMVASFAIASVVLPRIGGVFDTRALILCTLCPMLIAWPASAYAIWQRRLLAQTNAALKAAHSELTAVHARLAEKARRDAMTGMLNRESFFQALEAGRRKHEVSALLIVDADHFKTINDSHGHLTGDEALIEITGAICRASGKDGVVGRIGGEEFGVFLPGATDSKAKLVGERIRREVEHVAFKNADGLRVPLTVSVGGATSTIEQPLADLIRQADRHMYEAKRRGRNRMVQEPGLNRAA